MWRIFLWNVDGTYHKDCWFISKKLLFIFKVDMFRQTSKNTKEPFSEEVLYELRSFTIIAQSRLMFPFISISVQQRDWNRKKILSNFFPTNKKSDSQKSAG